MPYTSRVHTVIETEAYLRAVKDTKMDIDEQEAAVRLVSADPEGCDVMQGTGGVRKARLAGRGKGKSGGSMLTNLISGNPISAVGSSPSKRSNNVMPKPSDLKLPAHCQGDRTARRAGGHRSDNQADSGEFHHVGSGRHQDSLLGLALGAPQA